MNAYSFAAEIIGGKLPYRHEVWEPAGCDLCDAGLALVLFDAALHCGVRDAVRWLQQAVGAPVDGIIGPVTRAAIRETDPLLAVTRLQEARFRATTQLTQGREQNGDTSGGSC